MCRLGEMWRKRGYYKAIGGLAGGMRGARGLRDRFGDESERIDRERGIWENAVLAYTMKGEN